MFKLEGLSVRGSLRVCRSLHLSFRASGMDFVYGQNMYTIFDTLVFGVAGSGFRLRVAAYSSYKYRIMYPRRCRSSPQVLFVNTTNGRSDLPKRY